MFRVGWLVMLSVFPDAINCLNACPKVPFSSVGIWGVKSAYCPVNANGSASMASLF